MACVDTKSAPKKLYYEGREWTFPVTIGEATRQQKLQFQAPGHYYTRLPSGVTVRLEFIYETGDYDSEQQPETALYDRRVTNYLFTYPNRNGLIDSLKQVLARQIKRPMIAVADTQRLVVEGKTIFKQSIAYWRGLSPDSLVLAVRQAPSFKPQKEHEGQVEVFIFGAPPRNGIDARLRAF